MWKPKKTHPVILFLGNIENAVMREDLNYRHVNIPKQDRWLEIVQEICVMKKLTYQLRVREADDTD